MLLKTTMAYHLQNEHYIFVRYLFSQSVIFSCDPFCYSLLGISFRRRYMIKVVEVKKQLTFNLYIQMLRNCVAYFSQNPQIRNWWELCSLYVHYFPRVFLSVYFCFACQICAHAQFFGKFKTNASRPYVRIQNFALLILRILVLSTCEVCIFHKKQATF